GHCKKQCVLPSLGVVQAARAGQFTVNARREIVAPPGFQVHNARMLRSAVPGKVLWGVSRVRTAVPAPGSSPPADRCVSLELGFWNLFGFEMWASGFLTSHFLPPISAGVPTEKASLPPGEPATLLRPRGQRSLRDGWTSDRDNRDSSG